MSKWLTGLTEGFALALKCSLCEKVSFPPQKICTCGSYKNSWIKLSGVAEIVTMLYGKLFVKGKKTVHYRFFFMGADIWAIF